MSFHHLKTYISIKFWALPWNFNNMSLYIKIWPSWYFFIIHLSTFLPHLIHNVWKFFPLNFNSICLNLTQSSSRSLPAQSFFYFYSLSRLPTPFLFHAHTPPSKTQAASSTLLFMADLLDHFVSLGLPLNFFYFLILGLVSFWIFSTFDIWYIGT